MKNRADEPSTSATGISSFDSELYAHRSIFHRLLASLRKIWWGAGHDAPRVLHESQVLAWSAWDKDARRWISGAFQLARQQRHVRAEPLHILAFIVRNENFPTTILSPTVEEYVTEQLSDADASPDGSLNDPFASVALSRLFTRVLDVAREQERYVAPYDIVIALCADDRCGQILRANGFALSRLRLFMQHGVDNFDQISGQIDPTGERRAAATEEAPTADEVVANAPSASVLDVVMHNDDFTTQDVVVDILKNVFALQPNDAHDFMMTIHLNGHARVARNLDRERALQLARDATDVARELGMPLRLTLAIPEP